MAKAKDEKVRIGRGVKITDIQREEINNLLKDKGLRYKDRADFIYKAVDAEIERATLKHGLSPGGKVYFERLYNDTLIKICDRAKQFDTPLPPPKV
jgi:hypothetical protein